MKRVYLVDDDPIFVFLVKKILETVNSSLIIEIFRDGDMAITHLETIKDDPQLLPDLIFLDLNMPVLDGWGFLDQYATMHDKLTKDPTLYILSSTISTEDITRAVNYRLIRGFLI